MTPPDLRKPTKRVRERKQIRRSPPPRRSKRPRRASAKRPKVIAEDAAWAKAVREKYGDRCFHCWCINPATDTHHIIGKKAHPKLRYVVENGAPMCRQHHDEAHARPKWFKDNFRGWYHARWCRLMEMYRG
jgi:predicted restriction endonuclease